MSAIPETIGVIIFQFLLVRLRVLVVAPKRVATTVISIPSGAIKSLLSPSTQLYRNEFQFLLVRLRVLSLRRFIDVAFISIPSGAIKSGI